ncbi:MAG: C-GCAxxG-C-C family (seleno)protein [Candidatus Izemoplasmatales bacterium]|nr:C-GCAxxG-C-C family (seleno)protein [Candidatus Izemoplasmatales bacterium]
MKKYYLEKNYNCAETILRISNEEFHLDLDESVLKIMAGFGGGMYQESTCGVVTGGIAVLSLVFPNKLDLEQVVINYQNQVKQIFNSIECINIKPLHREELNRCSIVIDKAYIALTKIIINAKEKTE